MQLIKKKSSCKRYVEYLYIHLSMQDQACCFQMCNKIMQKQHFRKVVNHEKEG